MSALRDRVVSAVLIAVILAALAAIWQLVSGRVRESVAPVPDGAVVAFDLPDGCPEGWQYFADGQSRLIIGAVFDSSQIGNDTEGQQLNEYEFRVIGGKEQHMLRIAEMPGHIHSVTDQGHRHRVSGGFSARDSDNSPGGGELTNGGLARGAHYSAMVPSGVEIEPEGGNASHPNMPPYIPLFYCKKE